MRFIWVNKVYSLILLAIATIGYFNLPSANFVSACLFPILFGIVFTLMRVPNEPMRKTSENIKVPFSYKDIELPFSKKIFGDQPIGVTLLGLLGIVISLMGVYWMILTTINTFSGNYPG